MGDSEIYQDFRRKFEQNLIDLEKQSNEIVFAEKREAERVAEKKSKLEAELQILRNSARDSEMRATIRTENCVKLNNQREAVHKQELEANRKATESQIREIKISMRNEAIEQIKRKNIEIERSVIRENELKAQLSNERELRYKAELETNSQISSAKNREAIHIAQLEREYKNQYNSILEAKQRVEEELRNIKWLISSDPIHSARQRVLNCPHNFKFLCAMG